MSLGLIFSGQGGQHPDMLPWLDHLDEPSPAINRLQLALGHDWRARSRDPDWIKRNDVAQALVCGISLAAWQHIKPLLPMPIAIAGYSVGELAAFCAAGVFDIDTALRLAERRAELMDACVPDVDSGLMSVSGFALAQTEAICRDLGLQIAIHTGPDTFIVGGLVSDLDAAADAAQKAGARCGRLAVSLASHTRWMDGAVAPFALQLDAEHFAKPQTPLVCNLNGQMERDPAALRAALSRQLAAPVLWDRCMDNLAERGVRCVLEIGPGSMLARLWNIRFPDWPARSLDEFRDPAKAADWVSKTLAGG